MRASLLSFVLFTALATAQESPTAAKQIPRLAEMPDSTADLQSQIAETGNLILPAGVHRITKPLEIKLGQKSSTHIRTADGPASIIMDGPGPAIRVVGSHEGTAGPTTFEPATWNERMPIVEGIEIVGNHPQASGVELFQTVGAIVNKVSVRWCRHGIILAERNRNVIISDVHLYENSGIGLYLDDVNLHQINVSNSHISYNRLGGIVVRDGNVRNLHITGCDIEGNMPADDT
ncbi:right-handed parallel beta-helix repeat-containing protein, partial [Verrucomicrobiales bacterium]|nr:right-handed parallel beta-helix repeat-containing protein [Verrucomicrobiales bacterium]